MVFCCGCCLGNVRDELCFLACRVCVILQTNFSAEKRDTFCMNSRNFKTVCSFWEFPSMRLLVPKNNTSSQSCPNPLCKERGPKAEGANAVLVVQYKFIRLHDCGRQTIELLTSLRARRHPRMKSCKCLSNVQNGAANPDKFHC